MMQAYLSEISQRDISFRVWDKSHAMAQTVEIEETSPLYERLMAIRPPELSPAEWARNARVSSSFFQDVRKGASPRIDTMEKVLGAIGFTYAQFKAMDAPVLSEVRGAGVVGTADVRREFFGAQPLPKLPLYGSAVGGEYGDVDKHIELTELRMSEVLDYLERPASLAADKEAYTLEIVGDSMAPRYKPAEKVAVSPRASIAIGDDVIVQLRCQEGDDERIRMVLIKELVRRTATHVELKQHNPEIIFRIPREEVAAMHKVKGHYL